MNRFPPKNNISNKIKLGGKFYLIFHVFKLDGFTHAVHTVLSKTIKIISKNLFNYIFNFEISVYLLRLLKNIKDLGEKEWRNFKYNYEV